MFLELEKLRLSWLPVGIFYKWQNHYPFIVRFLQKYSQLEHKTPSIERWNNRVTKTYNRFLGIQIKQQQKCNDFHTKFQSIKNFAYFELNHLNWKSFPITISFTQNEDHYLFLCLLLPFDILSLKLKRNRIHMWLPFMIYLHHIATNIQPSIIDPSLAILIQSCINKVLGSL